MPSQAVMGTPCLNALSTLDCRYKPHHTSCHPPPTQNCQTGCQRVCHPGRSGFPKKLDFFQPLCKSINQVIHLPPTRGSDFSNPCCVAQTQNTRETSCMRSVSELPVKEFSTDSFVLVLFWCWPFLASTNKSQGRPGDWGERRHLFNFARMMFTATKVIPACVD